MKWRFAWIAIALLAVLPGSRAHAQTGDLSELLEGSIITTASHIAETGDSAPATSTTIDGGELRRYGIHTLEEAINFLALGVSSTGGHGTTGGVDLGSRGVALANDFSAHFLLLIDGHTVNAPFLGAISVDRGLGIPLEFVDHIEVIVGPGSVLYGSNAMLGVINVVTKGPARSYRAHAGFELELPVGWQAQLHGSTVFDLFGERATLSVAAQHWHQYGPRFEVGPVEVGIDAISGRPTRTTREGPETGVWAGVLERSNFAYVSAGVLALRVGRFELTLRGSWDRRGQPFAPRDFDDPGTARRTRVAAVDAKYSRLFTPQLRLALRGYADGIDVLDRFHLSRTSACPYFGVRTCEYQGRAISRWAGTEAQLSYDWTTDGRWTTLLGVDARARSQGTKQDVVDFDAHQYLVDSTGIIDVVDGTLGAYAQQIWRPLPELVVNAGARVDYDPRFSPVLSPRAALSYAVWHAGTLRAIYSEAFRAPSLLESEGGTTLIARADRLEPETVRSVEGSFEQRFGAHRLFFGVFRTWWRNLIELRFLTPAEERQAFERGLLQIVVPGAVHTQHQNAASIENYGFNAGVEGRFAGPRLRYGLNVTEAYSRQGHDDGEDTLLPAAPRLSAKARVALELPDPLPTLALAGYLLTPRLIDRGANAGFDPTPYAPLQIDLRATATGLVPLGTGWSYRVSADRVIGNEGPYVIGSLLDGSPESPQPTLDPIAAFRFSIGLSSDFGDD